MRRGPQAPAKAAPPARGAPLPFFLGCLAMLLLAGADLFGLPGGGSLGQVMLILGLPVWFLAALARERGVFGPPVAAGVAVIMAAVGFLFFWALISATATAEPVRAGRYLISLAAAPAMWLLVLGTATRSRARWLGVAMAAGLAAVCVITIIAYPGGPLRPLVYFGDDRARGFFKHPNQFGIVLSAVVPVVAALVFADLRRNGLLALCLGLLLAGLVLSGSKTNLLLAALSLSALLVLREVVAGRGRVRWGVIGLSLAGAGTLIALGILALQRFNARALGLLDTFLVQGEAPPSIESRYVLWQESLRQFELSPWLGQGPGQNLVLDFGDLVVSHSHNAFLDYLRSLGAPGLAGIVIVYAAAGLASLAAVRAALAGGRGDAELRMLTLGLAFGSLSYLVSNLMSDSFGPTTSPFFWLIFFLGAAAHSALAPRPRAGSSRPAALPEAAG